MRSGGMKDLLPKALLHQSLCSMGIRLQTLGMSIACDACCAYQPGMKQECCGTLVNYGPGRYYSGMAGRTNDRVRDRLRC